MEPPDLRHRLHNILDNAHDGAYGSTTETVDALMEAVRREAVVSFGSPATPAPHPLDERTVSVWTFARPTGLIAPDAEPGTPVVTIGGVAVPGVREVSVCAPSPPPQPVPLAAFVPPQPPPFVEVVLRIPFADSRRVFDDGVYAWVTRHEAWTRVPYVDRAPASNGAV